jgi:putative Holliday junction resolvase
MRYLALDIGDRWVGVALSDPTGWLASPLTTFRRKDRRQDIALIDRLIKEHEVQALVVGLPMNMDGTMGDQAARTMAFARDLEKLGCPVTLCDERLSSFAAQRSVIEARGRGPRRGERLDAHAAAIFLQDYLDSLPAPAARGDGGSA